MAIAQQSYTIPDFTPLTTLIGIVVAQGIGYAIYSLKASKENSKNGLTYDLTMMHENAAYQQHYDDDLEGRE